MPGLVDIVVAGTRTRIVEDVGSTFQLANQRVRLLESIICLS